LYRSQAFPGTRELWGKALKFLDVERRQGFKAFGAVLGEM
jgi:hypothetical protein